MRNQLTDSNRGQQGLVLVLTVILVFTASLGADESSRDKVAVLHEERIAVLEELVKVRQLEYSERLSPFAPIVRALDQLTDAKCDAANTKAERLAARKQAVSRWREFEEIVTAQFEAELVSQGDLLEAKAGHLRAKLLAAEELDTKE